MKKDILVSIDCITFNHEKYIARTIEGFLMQETDFAYEILIHDDASTDGTTSIIKEYERKYPELIKVIYQNENQYSQGKSIWKINSGRAVGKYIAICEGDDFWTDPFKLQKQVDYMETHPETSVSVHAAIVVEAEKFKRTDQVRPSNVSRYFTIDEVIAGDGGLFATNSMLFRRKYFHKLPRFYDLCPVSDYPLMIYLALVGKVYYMDDFMSAYQINTGESWTDNHFYDQEKIRIHYESINQTLNEVNYYTDGVYEDTIKKRQSYNDFVTLMLQGNYQEMKKAKHKEYYNSLNKSLKFKLFLKKYFPKIFALGKRVRLAIRKPVY